MIRNLETTWDMPIVSKEGKIPALFELVASLATTYQEGMESSREKSRPILRTLAAAQLLCFPRATVRFCALRVPTKIRHPGHSQLNFGGIQDPLYFLTHKSYISQHFTLRQRVQCAIAHHEYELSSYTPQYIAQVYHSDGIVLWDQSTDHRLKLVLKATDDARHEGELSVDMCTDDIRVGRMSFCYLDTSILGLPPSTMMLITRNQVARPSDRKLFDRCFPQKSSPRDWCLAAICGIARANEFDNVLAIKHDAQVAYTKAYAQSFLHSYTELWERYEGVEIDQQHVFRLNVARMNEKGPSWNHLGRAHAEAQRKYWDEMTNSASSVFGGYRR